MEINNPGNRNREINNPGNRNRVPVTIIEGADYHAIRTAGVLKVINQIYISKLRNRNKIDHSK